MAESNQEMEVDGNAEANSVTERTGGSAGVGKTKKRFEVKKVKAALRFD